MDTMIKPVWYNFEEIRPQKSGFYMFRSRKEIEIFYYCQPLDYILMLEYDYYYGVPARHYGFRGITFWAKMPKLPQSKILNDSTIKIAM